jgi:hypothetical protein
MGMIPLSYLVYDAFVEVDLDWHVFKIKVLLVSNYFTSATFQFKL